MNQQLLVLAIQQTPVVVGLLQALFKRHNVDEPVPTEAEVIAAFQSALQSSLAKDEAWLAAHPEPPE